MDTDVVGLGRYRAALRRRRWIIVVSVLLFAGLTTGYVATKPAKYEATAQVLLKPYSTGKFSETAFTSAQVDTQVEVMKSLTIVAPVVDRLNLSETATTLQKSITSTSVGDTSVIEVTVAGDSPTQAALIANSLAERYLEFRSQALPPNAQGSFATIVSRAQPPKHRSGPSLLLGALLGIVIGLVIGCAAALVADRRDTSVKDGDAIDEATGDRPVVGRIPAVRRMSRGPARTENPGSPESIAYRFLATTVRVLSRDHQARAGASAPTVVAIVSAAPREGRTSVAVNIARAAAGAGEQVVLFDADLTQPALTRILGIRDEIGLDTLLRRPPPLGIDLMEQPEPNLYVIGTHVVVDGQSALFADNGFRGLVDRLPKTVDLVIMDTSPLLSSADVLDLLPQADVVLAVVRERFSKRSDLEAALERIDQVGVGVTGVVVTASSASMGTQRTTR